MRALTDEALTGGSGENRAGTARRLAPGGSAAACVRAWRGACVRRWPGRKRSRAGVRRVVLRRPKAGGAPRARSCRRRRAPGHAKTGIATDLAAQGTKKKKEHIPVRQKRRATRL